MRDLFRMGLDIGYSNLKLVTVNGGSSQHLCRPAGAAPVERLPEQLHGGGHDIFVKVDGDTYAAGVAQTGIQQWQRSLDDDYAASPVYRALFHAALALAGNRVIDVLVTGLPVSHYTRAPERKTSLATSLRGTHVINDHLSVEVRQVRVVPQPVGAFFAMLDDIDDPDMLEGSRVLVVDPGFFSFDWVVIEDARMHDRASGTSTLATSAILEAAAERIHAAHRRRVSIDRLEQAVRNDAEQVHIGGTPIELEPLLAEAADEVVPDAVAALLQSLRKEHGDIDLVFLAGGGARFYQQVLGERFAGTPVRMASDPVMANAIGFARIAEATAP